MKLNDGVKDVLRRYVAAFPVPQGAQGEAFEEVARQWTIRFAEQVAYERLGEGYGMKRADSGRPVSKDTLSRLWDHLYVWDLLNNTGTGRPTLVDDPDSKPFLETDAQVFVPVVPTNHLGIGNPVDLPPPPPLHSDDVVQRLERIEATLGRVQDHMAGLLTSQEARAGFAQIAGVSLSGTQVAVGRKLTLKAKP